MKTLTILTVAVAFILTSCSKKDEGVHNLREAKGGIRYGGTFNMNETGDMRSLDPVQINDATSRHIGENIYDQLLTFDSALNLNPTLAKSYEISPDGLTYTFHLRDDVYFNDDPCFPNGKGRKFVANDVVYSWTRALDPSTNTLAFAYFQVIKGGKEYFDSKAQLPGVEGLQAPNDTTFIVTLKEAFSPFINYVAVSNAFIVPKEAIEHYGKDFAHHGVGTGPFRFVEYKQGRYCILVRNPNYWDKDEHGNQLPYLDTIKYTFMQDNKPEFLEFKAGKLDHVYRIPNEFYQQVVDENKNLKGEYTKYQMTRLPAIGVQFHGFNITKPGVANRHLRRAIAFAIDRKKIVKYVLKGQAYLPGEHGLVPPSMPGYPFESVKGFVFNRDSALAELELAKKELGGNLPELTLQLNKGGGRNEDVAQAVQAQIKENLGLEVNLQITEWAQHTANIDEGKASYFRLGWIADYPDPQNFLNLLYGKNIPASGPSSINQTRYRNPEFDRLYEAAIREIDRTKAMQLWAQADQVSVVDAAQIILFYDEDYHLIQPWVRNFPSNAQDNRPMKECWFAE